MAFSLSFPTFNQVAKGQHKHGKKGATVRASRWNRHHKDGGCTRFKNALRKYGRDAFEWYILDRLPSSDVNAEEIRLISPEGYNTKSPNGYNLDKGGAGLFKSSRGTKARWATPGFKEKMSIIHKEVSSRPEVKASRSKGIKAAWARDEYRTKTIKSMEVAQNRPDVKARVGAASKKTWNNMAYKVKMSSIRKDTWMREGYTDKMSTAQKKRFTNVEYKEKHSMYMKSMRNSESVKQKRRATILKKREAVLNACTSAIERKKKLRQYHKTDQQAQRVLCKKCVSSMD